MKTKRLKLTKLTLSNLERVNGGDEPPVCFCQVFPDGSTDEAFHHVGHSGEPFCTWIKTSCGC